VFEDPGGAESAPSGGWAFQFDRGPEGDKFKFDELMAAGALLLGRATYEGFARAWPAMNDDEFGKRMNSMPKYVVSSTLRDPGWTNTTVITGSLSDRIAELKQRLDGDIVVHGSGQLVRSLTSAGLVDEYRLMVYPTVVGQGKRLFDGLEGSVPLRVKEVRQAGDTTILIFGRR
jgi:dihydrofolate reductase